MADMTEKELMAALVARHNDTWPRQIGHGDLINEDGPEAAAMIRHLIAAREALATWMISNGYATGHGDDVEGLLAELDWQHKERRAALTA